jgi:hypothetical protein
MTATAMTCRSDDAEQLALRAVTVERDALRAELEAARAALGAPWCGGTLAEGITRKYAWLEALANEETR